MKTRKIFFWWAIICNQMCLGSDFILSKPSTKNVISDEASSKKGFGGVEKQSGVTPSLSQQSSSSQELVAFNFEDVDLLNVTQYMERIHQVKFIIPESLDINTDKGLGGHKLSFRTFKNLSKKDSWDLYVKFLNLAGFDIVPMPQPGFYNIVPFAKALTEPVPTYINVDPKTLPSNDMIIRYVYFLENLDPSKIQPLILRLQGGAGKLEVYGDLKALIFMDKSYNIQSLMKIVKELDSTTMPQMLSAVRLKTAVDVGDVIDLYNSLRPNSGQTRAWAPQKATSSLEYFPQDATLVGDKRTNTLFILGSQDAVKRIEDFITTYIDVNVKDKVIPPFTYTLEYVNATDIKALLDQVLQYGNGTPAGTYGGIRDGYKFLQPVNIVADNFSNSLVITALPQDFAAVSDLIKELDQPQQQVAIEALFLEVTSNLSKEAGMQISSTPSQSPQTFFKTGSAQTSFLNGIVATATGNQPPADAFTIRTSLSGLLSSIGNIGTTLLTFGQPIWAVFRILQQITDTKVIANPFTITSNNTPAYIKVGETRRITTGVVQASGSNQVQGLGDCDALLSLNVTPQVNKDGIINLNINISNTKFLDSATSQEDGTRGNKQIQTFASLADGEVLVLGGLMSDNISSTRAGFPLLEKIPVFGWFFKSKTRSQTKDSFVVFISVKVLDPAKNRKTMDTYTQAKIDDSQRYIALMEGLDGDVGSKDPLNRAFFGTQSAYSSAEHIDHYTGKSNASNASSSKLNAREERLLQRKLKQHNKEKKEYTAPEKQPARRRRKVSKQVAQEMEKMSAQAPKAVQEQKSEPRKNLISITAGEIS